MEDVCIGQSQTRTANGVCICSEEKIFQKLTKQKQELSMAAMFVYGSRRNQQSLQRTFYRFFLPSFCAFDKAVSEEKNLEKSTIQNKNCLWRYCLLTFGTRWDLFIEDLPQMLHTKFRSIWQSGFKKRRLKCEKLTDDRR